MEKANGLLLDTKYLDLLEFKSSKDAKHYAHELYRKLQNEELKLMEEKRKIDNKIYELRHAESKVFDYYLSKGEK